MKITIKSLALLACLFSGSLSAQIPYEFNCTDYIAVDGRSDGRFSYDESNNTFTIAASGPNNIAFQMDGRKDGGKDGHYYISKEHRYFAVKGTNLNVETSENSYIWWFNGFNNGAQIMPTHAMKTSDGEVLIIWDIKNEPNLYGNMDFTQEKITLTANRNSFINCIGLTSTGESSTIKDIGYYSSETLMDTYPELKYNDYTAVYIQNPSFEDGKPNSWTLENINGLGWYGVNTNDGDITASDGNCLFGVWGGSATLTPSIYQTVTLPKGDYILTVDMQASGRHKENDRLGNQRLFAGDKSSLFKDQYSYAGIGDKVPFRRIWLEFTQDAEKEIKIGVAIDGARELETWFKIDNFRLYKKQTAANMTITDAGWATFIAPFDVKIPEYVTAYIVTGVEGTILTKEEVNETIRANTPVLLKGEEGLTYTEGKFTQTFYGQNTATQDTNGDVLVGNISGETMFVPNNGESFVLLKQDGNLGFYKVATDDIKVDNNRCYLNLNVPTGSEIKAFFFDDEATGINGIADDATVVERYNAAGMKVAAPVKGLNIVKLSNGKVQKVLVK